MISRLQCSYLSIVKIVHPPLSCSAKGVDDIKGVSSLNLHFIGSDARHKTNEEVSKITTIAIKLYRK
jgi:hypothetical protein